MRCTGKEQLTCNEEKMGCEGCYYAREETSIQEDIKVLEELKNKKYIVDKVEGWEQYLLTTRQQIAIENLIARNKELEKLSENIKMFRDNNLSSEIDYVIALKSNFMEYLKTDYISKSKIEEEFERMTSHANCFNLGDMNDLLDRILN